MVDAPRKFGLWYFPTDYGMDPAEYGMDPLEFARAAEDHGFESLFVVEHTHVPVTGKSRYPGPKVDLPREHSHTLHPFVLLGALAAVTTKIRLGTGIVQMNQHHPINIAKATATLDQLSDGRLILGVAPGWNVDELWNHGVDPATRFEQFRERINATRVMWTENEAEFHGEHIDFGPIWVYPKPKQPGGPPILIGGDGATVEARIAEYGDGWLTLGRNHDDLAGRVERVCRLTEERGRPAPDVTVIGVHRAVDFRTQTEAEVRALSDVDGVTRYLFPIPSAPRDQVLAKLDEYATLMPVLQD